MQRWTQNLRVQVVCRYYHLWVYFLFVAPPCTKTLPSPPGWWVSLAPDNASFSPRLRSGIYMKLLIVCSSNRVSLEPAVCQKLRTDSLTSPSLLHLLSESVRTSPLPADQHDKTLAGAGTLGITLPVPPWRTPRPSPWLAQKGAAECVSPRWSAVHSRPTLDSAAGSDGPSAATSTGEGRCAPGTPFRRHCKHG